MEHHRLGWTVWHTRCNIRPSSKSVSRQPARITAAGFVLGAPLPSKPPVHRPAGARSAAVVKAELDRLRPSARAGATVRAGAGPRRIPGAPPTVRAVQGGGSARAGDGGGSRRASSRRSGPVLGRDELGCAVQTLSRRQDRARGPLGLRRADALRSRGPGGGHLSKGRCSRDRARRALCVAAKFGRGVSGRSLAEPLNSCP